MASALVMSCFRGHERFRTLPAYRDTRPAGSGQRRLRICLAKPRGVQQFPPDSPAFDQALADIRAKRQVLQQTLQAVVSKAAPTMSPEGRKQLADWTGVKSTS